MIDPSPWSNVALTERTLGGHRSEVWRGHHGDEPVAVRRSRRTAASLAWEIDLLDELDRLGFRVPSIIPADDGRPSVDGVVVQRWLGGREPETESDWRRVGRQLVRLHRATVGHGQRPGCSTVLELATTRRSVDADLDSMPDEVVDRIVAVFEEFGDVPTAVVHGDPSAGNIRIGRDGTVGLLDWDESRVDVTWHDLSDLGVQLLDDRDHRRAQRLSNAWESANGWIVEPDYARRRLDRLSG